MADAGAAAAAGATAAAASTFAAHEPPARRNGAPEPEPELEPRARPTFRLMGLGAIGRWTPIVEDAGYSPAADGDAVPLSLSLPHAALSTVIVSSTASESAPTAPRRVD